LPKEPDQLRVGALVEDQKASVNAVFDTIEPHINRVRMPAEPALGLEQRDARLGRQAVSDSEARDAGADDGDAAHASARPKRRRGTAGSDTPSGKKDCCAAPLSEGGREGGGGEALWDCSQTIWKAAQHAKPYLRMEQPMPGKFLGRG
jgi:hypothetical protein